jgi:hypothetical protein
LTFDILYLLGEGHLGEPESVVRVVPIIEVSGEGYTKELESAVRVTPNN